MLWITPEHDRGYFRFKDSGKYWLKGGADSPENFLGYADFDGTYKGRLEDRDGEAKAVATPHAYAPHPTEVFRNTTV